MITFGVPSGIGDVSWMYSKLKHAGDAIWQVADGWPHRTAPFLAMLPNVFGVGYDKFNFRDICAFEEAVGFGGSPKWADVLTKTNGANRILIEANRHLEAGKRLEDWLPDLPTDFHYHISVAPEEKAKALDLLRDIPRPLWGISAASYRGSEAWKTWGFLEWRDFLKWFHAQVGGTIVLIGGFWDDLTFALSRQGYYDLVGKTSVPMMVQILNELDGYIGFSSGLGILRTVLDKPVFMMWPDHQVELSTSWAPPAHLETRKYVSTTWKSPELMQPLVELWLKLNY